jgi:hypothetical protein
VIAGVYGDDVTKWIGQSITLWVDPDVSMGRKRVGGIRPVNTRPTESPTADALDNEPDPATSAMLEEAFVDEREPGEEG